MIKAISVIAHDDFTIEVTLEDGRAIKLDMVFIKSQRGPVVEPLHQLAEFRKVFVRNGIVTWPTGFDVDPYYLIESGSVLSKSA
ncbi:MAG: hypothetical protein A2428_07920 [Bdellovibrionales bacterium RIFOXYC1_FULL_54_43]|nr:MAG: hypothetical protein A2428_07920 [Bdellovibrionales bacterium RIFOXYC1_FULL_54_43]OFZ84846.1 MAG: hypothetical protein A2603_02995 [Bdellovibrionales bacterium RIFOXYD1_FULL_55_31]